MSKWIVSFFLLAAASCFAEEVPQGVQTQAAVKIEGKRYPYTATVGTLTVLNEKGQPRAHHSYTYYKLSESEANRPLTFCFNGGPGSSSVWLHVGAFGPKRWNKAENRLENNPTSLLSETDLVFVDPVGTGWSKPAEGVEEAQFYGVEEDIEELSLFIRTFLGEFKRWGSPKYILGESYGTFRAVGLCERLAEKHQISLDGLVLISSVFDLQSISFDSLSNKLPYILFTPAMTLVAQDKGRLSAPYQSMSRSELIKSCQEFCYNRYLPALYLGESISPKEKEEIAEQLSLYIGISKEDLLAYNLQLHPMIFRKLFFKGEGKQLGRFDGRIEGFSCRPTGEVSEWDPSYDDVIGPITASFCRYLQQDLGWEGKENYEVMNVSLCTKWKWNDNRSVLEELRCSLLRYPNMKVFIASGLFDLATPFTIAEYSLNQLYLPLEVSKRVRTAYYEGGHMMYFEPGAAKQLRNDLEGFYSR